MSNKIQLIKEEIERRIHFLDGMVNTDFGEGVLDTLNKLKHFIDSLPEEPASEDLDEAARKYCQDMNYMQPLDFNPSLETITAMSAFKAGYEWGKKHK